MPPKVKAEFLGPSRLSRVLEGLKQDSPGHLPSLLALKVTVPAGAEHQRTFRSFLKKDLPKLYYANPACKLTVQNANSGERANLACKFIGRKEDIIPLSESSLSTVLRTLKELDPISAQAAQSTTQAGVESAPSLLLKNSQKARSVPARPPKDAARIKARTAWELSRHLDTL